MLLSSPATWPQHVSSSLAPASLSVTLWFGRIKYLQTSGGVGTLGHCMSGSFPFSVAPGCRCAGGGGAVAPGTLVAEHQRERLGVHLFPPSPEHLASHPRVTPCEELLRGLPRAWGIPLMEAGRQAPGSQFSL